MRLALVLALLWNLGPAAAFAGPAEAPKAPPMAVPSAALQFPGLPPGAGQPLLGGGLAPSLGALPALEGSLPALPSKRIEAPPALEQEEEKAQEETAAPGLEQAGKELGKDQTAQPGSEASAAPLLSQVFDASSNPPAAVSEFATQSSPLPESAETTGPSRSAEVSLKAAPEEPAPAKAKLDLRPAVPNLITGLNLTSGLGAMLLAAQGSVAPAAGLIILATVFDALDGRAARALGVSSPMGIELDSLADVVSFGAAPAILIYKAAFSGWGPWGFALAAPFAVAGAYRLARFNLGAQAEKAAPSTAKKSDSFTGLPIPGGAGVLVATALGLSALPAAYAAPIAAAITLLTSAAMVSRLPYPAFKKGGLKALALPAAFFISAAVPLALLGHAALIPAAVFGGYLLTGPLIELYRTGDPVFQKELRRKAFHQLLLLYIPAHFLIGYPHIVGWLSVSTSVIAAVELLRLKVPAAKPFFEKFLGSIVREKEKNQFSGSLWGALGVWGTVALYGSHPAIVVASILALALGDAASPLFGMRVKFLPYKVRGTQRSVSGTAAGFTVAYLIALGAGCPPLAALAAAAAFSAADTLPLKPDDNLWIPLVFSTALFLLGLR